MGFFNRLFGGKSEPPPDDDESEHVPPTAERVAARAMVMALVVQRAYLEPCAADGGAADGGADADRTRQMLLELIEAAELDDEIEPEERALLESPVGRGEPAALAGASWRCEGVAALAWALKQFELPVYDQCIASDDYLSEGGRLTVDRFFSAYYTEDGVDLRDSAVLRPSAEIARFSSQITVVNWRLRQFRLEPGPMDFVGYLRAHPAFKELWLEHLSLVDGDLCFGGKAIAVLSEEEFDRAEGIVVERQLAAYWLEGDHALYSKVDPATILMAC